MAETAGSGSRGLEGVVAARTRMSHVDGQAGALVIGGYELAELAGHVTFEEAAHLLWMGSLPGREKLAALRAEMAALRKVLMDGGDIWARYVTSPEVGRFLQSRLYSSGRLKDWRETLRGATGETLGATALVEDLAARG